MPRGFGGTANTANWSATAQTAGVAGTANYATGAGYANGAGYSNNAGYAQRASVADQGASCPPLPQVYGLWMPSGGALSVGSLLLVCVTGSWVYVSQPVAGPTDGGGPNDPGGEGGGTGGS